MPDPEDLDCKERSRFNGRQKSRALNAFSFSVLTGLSLISASQAQKPDAAYTPVIPRTWDEQALADLEVPLADPSHSPKDISADDYYRIPSSAHLPELP